MHRLTLNPVSLYTDLLKNLRQPFFYVSALSINTYITPSDDELAVIFKPTGKRAVTLRPLLKCPPSSFLSL